MCRHASQHENLHKGIVAVHQAHKLYVREEAWAFYLDATGRDLADSPNVENCSRNPMTAVEENDLEENIPLLTEVQRNCTSLNLSNTFSSANKSRYLMLKMWVFIFIRIEELNGLRKWVFPAYSRAIHQRKVSFCIYLYVPWNVTMVLQWGSCLACGKSIPISGVAMPFFSQKLRSRYHLKSVYKNVKQMLEV